VRAGLFRENDFFDPHDLVQVKYEMLRHVRKDGATIEEAAQSFGFSRASFYLIREAFERDGLAGLMLKKRGPQHAHKLDDGVMEVILTALADDPSFSSKELAALVERRFGFTVHPRSIERALEKQKKKPRRNP
jgi:transposase